MTESIETPRAPAPPLPETGDERPETASAPVSFARALAPATVLVALSLAVGWAGVATVFGPVLVVAFAFEAHRRRVLRSQSLVMAEVTWLVLAVVLKLVFLEQMPATPLPVFASVLLIQ